MIETQTVNLAAPVTVPVNRGREQVSILIVDDQPGKLLAHESILEQLGERIVKAASGREALQSLLREEFAVILLDVNMPEMDGFETAALIRQRPSCERTPIIFITGYNTTDIDRLKGYGLGAVDYLFLPIIPEVLKAKVSVFVELARQNRVIRDQAKSLAAHNQEQARQLNTIQVLNQELRRANQELEAFSYTVSHDLRAPLRALLGYATILEEEYGQHFDTFGKECLGNLKRSVQQMDALTRDLLSYSRVSREELHFQPLRVEHLLSEIVALSPALQPPAAEFTVKTPLLPVQAHRTLLKQTLTNLLQNAVKFMAPGVTPKVCVETERRGNFVRVWIEDNGIGIDPSYHERIFGIFERVDGERQYEGTGIGLAIVARAMQRMGGQCGVVSTLGQGSRFWLDLMPAVEE